MTLLSFVSPLAAAIGFVLVGIVAVAQPAILSHGFGLYVHERNGRGFVRATGARDAAIGTMLLIFIFRVPGAIVPTLVVGAALALSDFILVWRTNREFDRSLAFHAFGIVFLLATATIVGITNLSR